MPRRVLLVSGSLRSASTNTAVLRTAAEVAPGGTGCRIYDRLARLPAFDPDEDRRPLHPEVELFREAIHEADAIVFSTPEYAGALPGSLKNLLDWTIGDDQVGSIDDKPVGWINASPRGADGAHAELRTVLGYAHARIIEAACVRVPVTPTMIGHAGVIEDEPARASVARVLAALARAVHASG
ncbi:MAG TPA: NADPH-dependent FMN reductase [Acidimicrobiales bacterium]|nr:NADPH-dependent FMN reductase [Acidimicrobiales bacterium]